MDPITRVQLENAAEDADTLEQVVNGGPDETIISRLGRTLHPLSAYGSAITQSVMDENFDAEGIRQRYIDTRVNKVNLVSGLPNEKDPALTNCSRVFTPDHAVIGDRCLKITTNSGAGTSTIVFDPPLADESAPLYIGKAGAIVFRPWIADASLITGLEVDLYTDGAGSSDKTWVRSVTAPTGAGYLVNKSGGYAIGATDIEIDTGTGTLGRYVTFAGDPTVYELGPGSTTSLLSIVGGLKMALADNTAVTTKTFLNGANTFKWTATEGIADLSAWGNVYKIRIIISRTGATDVYLTELSAVVAPKAQILMCIDGGYQSFISGPYEDLKTRKIPLTIAAIPGQAGTIQGANTVITMATLLALSQENANVVGVHSWDGETTATATGSDLIAQSVKAENALRAYGIAPAQWKPAFTGNDARSSGALGPYYSVLGSSTAASAIDMYPPKNRLDLPRWGLHGRSDAEIDDIFSDLLATNGLLVVYTHGYNTGDSHDVAADVWDYFMGKVDDGLADGTLECVTFEQLEQRSGQGHRQDIAGFSRRSQSDLSRNWLLVDDFGQPVITRDGVGGFSLIVTNDGTSPGAGNPSLVLLPMNSGTTGFGIKDVNSVTKFYARSDGKGYFGNDVVIAGMINAGIKLRDSATFNNDASPDVTGLSRVMLSASAPLNVTDFDNGVEGQVIVCGFLDSNVTVTRDHAYLAGGANFTSTANDVLVLMKLGSAWVEIARSVNS